ncbi:MAG TPA: hypothetical protein VKM55_09880 [Candidatus Lokiarchaeia archaeon]|nr:hypothetical protein [Candidatus Lokiarchaeia archaeon]
MIILLYSREPSIYQTQLNDFLGNPRKTIFHMNVHKEYYAGWKALYPRHAPKKCGRPSRHVLGHLETLDFWIGSALVTRTAPMYLKRCKSPRILTQDEVNSAFVSSWKHIALHAFPNFTGYVDYLFMDERFTFFDDVQFLL